MEFEAKMWIIATIISAIDIIVRRVGGMHAQCLPPSSLKKDYVLFFHGTPFDNYRIEPKRLVGWISIAANKKWKWQKGWKIAKKNTK